MKSTANLKPARNGPRRGGRRLEVLRTAAQVFSAHGFRQATLEDVANALQMTRPALYYYAESKDELLAECARIAFGELLESALQARSAGVGADQLRAFFRRYAEIICDDFGKCFVLTDLRELSDDAAVQNRAVQRELGQAVSGMVAAGIADGSLRPCNPLEVSRAMFAAFNGIARWWRGGDRRPAEIADGFVALFLDGVGSTGSPRPAPSPPAARRRTPAK